MAFVVRRGFGFRSGLLALKEMVPSDLHLPPTGIPKLSVANLADSKSTRWARSGGRKPDVSGLEIGVGVGGPDRRMQSKSSRPGASSVVAM